jgi:hypothetical protein
MKLFTLVNNFVSKQARVFVTVNLFRLGIIFSVKAGTYWRCTRLHSSISMGNVWLVIRSKCCLETNRWADANHGSNMISHILDLVNKSHIRITCLFSNSLFYCQCYLPLAAMLCLSHTLSLSLRYLAPFPPLSVWYKKNLSNLYTSSLFWINYSDSRHCCFTYMFAHNIRLEWKWLKVTNALD